MTGIKYLYLSNNEQKIHAASPAENICINKKGVATQMTQFIGYSQPKF